MLQRRIVVGLAAAVTALAAVPAGAQAAGFTLQWGASGDTPFTADFDGDGIHDVITWRPSSGHFYVAKSTNGYDRFNPLDLVWGTSGDVPMVGDVDGDSKADAIIYRPSTHQFRILTSGTSWSTSTPTLVDGTPLGSGTFTPLAVDVDGDGKVDLGAYEPNANGSGDSRWRFLLSSTGYSPDFTGWQEWGANGDVVATPKISSGSGGSAVDLVTYRPGSGHWYGINAASGLPIKRVLPVNPSSGSSEYNYAPDIIKQGSNMYAYTCHTPVASSGTDLDSITVAKSTDGGKTWSTPSRILEANVGTEATTGVTGNISYCDPSLVHFGGYYYLYNSNTLITSGSGCAATCWQTYVTVSRIPDTQPLDAAASNWLTYTDTGTWARRPTNAKAMVLPQRLITSGSIGYGAGEQSVLVKDGHLEMFYVDDSYLTPPPDFSLGIDNCWTIWKKTSTDPVDWSGTATQTNACGHSPIVKYDDVHSRYVLLRVDWAHTNNANLVAQYSSDGVTFGSNVQILDPYQLPDDAHNVGAEGDEYGHLATDGSGRTLVGWGAPADGRIDGNFWVPWDLDGAYLDVRSGSPPAASTDYAFAGPSGAQPRWGDVDGDGKQDLAFFDPSAGSGHEWTFSTSGGSFPSSANAVADVSSASGDVGLLGRFHGSTGADDLAFWHPATGDWTITYSGGGAVHAP